MSEEHPAPEQSANQAKNTTTDQPASQPHGEDNRLIAERRDKLQRIRESRNPFPNDFKRENYAGDLQARYRDVPKAELAQLSADATVAGRIIRKRGAFLVIQDPTDILQLYINRKTLDKDLLAEMKDWDLGDIVGARGSVQRSNKGDLYLDLAEARLLVKSLRPLPDKHKGLQDTEQRYRQRYVDLIVNPETRETFQRRSKMITVLRQLLDDAGFMEVETPMMQLIPGGAAARPFKTHHNALGLDMFLRIAPELYLKRLVVGGFERVYEINRNFRNEGLSPRHNPEFTMLEFYQAYADYEDLMDLTETMMRHLAEAVLGTTVLTYQGERYDFGKAMTRLTMEQAILQYNPSLPEDQVRDRGFLAEFVAGLGIEVQDAWGVGRLQLEIFEETVESRLLQPTFITQYPTEVSPLARRNDQNPEVADRFEFFIAGREIANGFSELNDAEDQAERFRQQVIAKESGDEEAMHFDGDYIRALEHGLPPTAGEGIGIDRLVMLFTDAPTIRDVLLFPHMRPEHA